MLKVLDLFSGIGGFSLGLERTGGFETVAFCEIDPYCRKVLAKHWPDVPCFEDVRELDATGLGRLDCITGGYPCQPFSHAGQRNGAQDDRHLWPAMFSIVQQIRPTWIIAENVAGHITLGLDQVLSDLEAAGYAATPFVIPACAVDAPHRRDRVWIVAHAERLRKLQPQRSIGNQRRRVGDGGEDVSNSMRGRNGQGKTVNQSALDEERNTSAHRERRAPVSGETRRNDYVADTNQQHAQGRKNAGSSEGNGSRMVEHVARCDADRDRWKEWSTEPSVGRVAHGIPSRVDRLKSLGNAVIPQIPELIGHAILEAEGLSP